jgi:predicted nucleic acid-binding protein
MEVLVDTPIWSFALRRRAADLNPDERHLTAALEELVRGRRAQIVGPVRQELLSGIRQESAFIALRDHLRPFDEPCLEAADYEEAARMANQCRSRGITGSPIDFLICAVAFRRDWLVFTSDRDFNRYATIVPVKLYAAR